MTTIILTRREHTADVPTRAVLSDRRASGAIQDAERTLRHWWQIDPPANYDKCSVTIVLTDPRTQRHLIAAEDARYDLMADGDIDLIRDMVGVNRRLLEDYL